MQPVTVLAIADFHYQGKAVHAGEPVPMVPIDAAVYARRRQVSLLERAVYATKDLVAAPVAAPVSVVVVEEPHPSAPKRRRRARTSKSIA